VDERWQATKDSVSLFLPGAKVMEDRPVSQAGMDGRELLVEAMAGEAKGHVRSRCFWAGRKLYVAMVTFTTEFLNARAADYFLESLRPHRTE
jgi:hypothetical protein